MEEKIQELIQQFKENHKMDILLADFYEMGLRKQIELKNKRETNTAEFCFYDALKKEYPSLVENIKLNVELFKINDNSSTHAFIEIKDGNEEPLIIDYARNNDAYIYRWEYHNDSDGVQPFLKDQEGLTVVKITANMFDDGDNIGSIAKKN